MNIILLGAPGAGKGTMAEFIRNEYGTAHISTGDLLRAEIKSGSELGKMASEYIEEGKLVPDEVIISMLGSRLEKDDCVHGVLLDGFPRTIAQAEKLAEKVDIDAVIYLDIDKQVLTDRILSRRICDSCGEVFSVKHYTSGVCDRCGGKLIVRDDDNIEAVNRRYDVFLEQTAPLVGYYGGRGLVSRIDASMAVEDEIAEIRSILEKLNND